MMQPSYILASFPGLTEAEERKISSASMYYTERKSKNKKRGRPGNEATYIQHPMYMTPVTLTLKLKVKSDFRL